MAAECTSAELPSAACRPTFQLRLLAFTFVGAVCICGTWLNPGWTPVEVRAHERFLAARPADTRECATVDISDSEVLQWLRARPFNRRTEEALANHPMVTAADEGVMPLKAVKLVLLEEYSIETSDLRSMAAALARHGGFQSATGFFQAAVSSEEVARRKLVKMAKVLGIGWSRLEAYQPMPASHAYTAYVTELAHYGGMGTLAAGFAVNFPAYGRMCGRIRDALERNYNMSESDVGFLSWFAAPSGPAYDASALAVIADGRRSGETLCQIERGVKLLQSYEQMFWDTVWAQAIGSETVTEPLRF